MRREGYRTCALVSASVLLSVAATAGWSQGFIWLGTLGGSQSHAYSVSADGSVVVGWAHNASGQPRAFRWTQATGMQDLGTLGGCCSYAYGVSADGSVVVGYAYDASNRARAFRWTQATGMQDLGATLAYGVSADGSVVVGQARFGIYSRAFRWTQAGGMQNLGSVSNHLSIALGVSADGNVVVGYDENTNQYTCPFRWTQATGMQTLSPSYQRGIVAAYGASSDGSIIVGSASGLVAFRWTQTGGSEDLSHTYRDIIGGNLHTARAITPDGRYIVGGGYNRATGRTEEAYLLHDPRCENSGDVDNNGCIDDSDLLTVLFAFGSSGSPGRVDINCDGTVDDADLMVILFNFGDGC